MAILYIALLTIFSSGVGTISGFGISTIMVPILSFFLPLSQTLLLVGIIHWFNDIWKMILFKKGFNGKLIFAFGVTGIMATYAGANITFAIPKKNLSQALGIFIIIYTLFLFLKPSFKIPQNNITAMSGGALSGFFAGIFGMGALYGVPFYPPLNYQKQYIWRPLLPSPLL